MRLRAEWEKQRGVLLAFPHAKSDWGYCLQEARENFLNVIASILRFEDVVLCVDVCDDEGMQIVNLAFAKEIESRRLKVYRVPCNDTWARDFGPLCVESGGESVLLDFVFNGWGLKFASCFDNQITAKLGEMGELQEGIKKVDMVLEGGSIECDGNGVILSSTQCLLEPNRNPWLSLQEIESKMAKLFGAKKFLWISQGYLAGDDTDSHIDTLARFLSPTQIAYVGCDDPQDEHYEALQKMEEQIRGFRDLENKPYELIKLPFVRAIYEENQRLPATYANFLFVNGALLVPTYGDENDSKALEILQSALPHLEVVGVDCQTLIRQHGSLHCITMQLY